MYCAIGGRVITQVLVGSNPTGPALQGRAVVARQAHNLRQSWVRIPSLQHGGIVDMVICVGL